MKTVKVLVLLVSLALLAAMIVPKFYRSPKRARAVGVFEDLRVIDWATEQYAIKYEKKAGDHVTWSDLQPFLKPGTRLYVSNGRDVLGGEFGISTVGTLPKVADSTFQALSDVTPPDWWSPFR